MAIYKVGENNLEELEETTFASERINERYDLQRLLRNCIDIIAPETKVIAEEFGRWTNSQRRIDLLAIDKDANLVVIELKRTQDGGNMEL
jgi:RecB family endonuclease NucS